MKGSSPSLFVKVLTLLIVGVMTAGFIPYQAPHSSNTGAASTLASEGGTLIWNTFLGDEFGEFGTDIAVDTSGNVYVTGYSSLFQVFDQVENGVPIDAFVAKYTNDGALLWVTPLGGLGADYGYGITVDSSGNTYVTGVSDTSWGNPVNNFSSFNEAFVAKVNSSGVLVWNTFLGGEGWDRGDGIAVSGGGYVYVAGYSTATWGDPKHAHTPYQAGFAAKLTNSGVLLWNTFQGGDDGEEGKPP